MGLQLLWRELLMMAIVLDKFGYKERHPRAWLGGVAFMIGVLLVDYMLVYSSYRGTCLPHLATSLLGNWSAIRWQLQLPTK